MDFGFWIGNIAAILTTVSYLPQVIKIIKTRDTQAISLPMYIAMVTGVACWLIYGFIYMLWPVILSNVVTIILALTILFFKLNEVYKQHKN